VITVGIIGLGYVGLPLAVAFAQEGCDVIAVDVDQRKIDAIEAGDELKAKLSELSHIIKGGVVDGWASLGNKVKSRLERWLVESARHLPTQNVPARAGQS